MKPIRSGLWSALCLTIAAALPAAAAEKPINISLFTPISLVKAEDGVSAFRFNFIYGRNTSVKVVDIGLINHTTKGESSGLQLGTVNFTEGTMNGLQLGFINYNKGTAKVFEWGGLNYAEKAGGLQLAFLNYAGSIDGVQIGVVNIIKKGGMFPVMVIANWSKK